MNTADPRLTLARPDLADGRLEGLVRAARFADVRARQCRAPVAALRKAPREDAALEDQLLFGEGFDVLEEAAGWAWGQARRDGYVGFVRAQDLGGPPEPPSHWVRALRTFGYAQPDLKSASAGPHSMNALVTAGERRIGFVQDAVAGWLFEDHLAPIGRFESDPVSVAERFLDAPYLWGGRDSIGLDCSGLIQQAFYACGRACPRDTDQQALAFERDVESAALQRGDLVFWKGHVAMLIDPDRIIHANAHHMAVAIEALHGAIERIRGAGAGEPLAFRRPWPN